jgi:hypothetical protein
MFRNGWEDPVLSILLVGQIYEISGRTILYQVTGNLIWELSLITYAKHENRIAGAKM